MSRKIEKYTVLIVCEGTNTEPFYFKSFEKYINKNYSNLYPRGISFTVFPYPKEKAETVDSEQDQIFTRNKKKRDTYNPEIIINQDIEDKYRGEPLRWVRYAQKEAKGAGFNQVWAVFDYDNRPDDRINEAFNLAENPDENHCTVDIAYSSYSFEMWIVLHYELFQEYLEYSECKDDQRKIIECGTNRHDDDCNGNKCLRGYLSIKNPEISSILKSKESTFPHIEDYIFKACIRSNFLINNPSNKNKKLYQIKPVTTVNSLIEKIITSFPKIVWVFNNIINFDTWEIKWLLTADSMSIQLKSDGSSTILIQKNKINILDNNMSVIYNDTPRIIKTDTFDGEVFKVSFKDIVGTVKYISFEYNNTLYISELI